MTVEGPPRGDARPPTPPSTEPADDDGEARPEPWGDLHFEVTPEDVVAYFVDRLMRSDRSRAAIRGARASILSAGAAVTIFGATVVQVSPFFLGAVLAATAASVLGYPAIFRRAGRRRIQAVVSSSPPAGALGPTRVRTDERGLAFERPAGEAELIPWTTLGLSVTRDHLFVTRGEDAARPRLIPSRAFATEEERGRFIERVRGALP